MGDPVVIVTGAEAGLARSLWRALGQPDVPVVGSSVRPALGGYIGAEHTVGPRKLQALRRLGIHPPFAAVYSDSAIDLRYSSDQRQLSLLRGELTLDSNGADNRPFIVSTRVGQLSTQNGQLLLRENDAGLLLAVRRGSVTVDSQSNPLRQVQAGQVVQLSMSGAASAVQLHGDPWAWTDGVLSVQQMPLGEFTAELARYRPGHLGVAPEVANLRITGSFPLHDTDKALSALLPTLPVQIEQHTPWWVTVAAKH